MESLKVLELYSGIGGMHYALKMSGIRGNVSAAVDINPNANLVYQHNFKETKVLQKTIEGLKIEELDKLDFDMILMSPPCQPFTRQGNQHGASDNRAQSFLALIQLIPKLKKRPKYILMENVKGFDQDEARNLFISMLKEQNYHYQEFLLSPIQFGIPNSRLRYFLIAKYHEPFQFETKQDIATVIPDQALKFVNETLEKLNFDLDLAKGQVCRGNHKIEDSLKAKANSYQLNENHKQCSQSESTSLFVDQVRPLSHFVTNEIGTNPDLHLSQEVFLKSTKLIDIVTANSTRSNCFTKNYGRYLEGTGSILMTNSESIVTSLEEPDKIELDQASLRFFSPKEISNLHCFPDEFEFPAELSTIQQWRLIGNSLNVFIVATLINLMTLF